MHVGALLGTIMAANVFYIIIPAQKALVKAARKNLPPDPSPGKIAGLRSLHNNYLTLPVVFVMISNHFPTTFGPSFNWIVLAILTLASVAVRHYINMYEKGKNLIWVLPFSFVALISLIYITAPEKDKLAGGPEVSFSAADSVISLRCRNCHSITPTDDVQTVAPNGVTFDTPEQIVRHAERIFFRAVETKTMPQANKTGMSEEERMILGRWIRQGARIE
jgi:uncharacterized membrane protein